MRTRVLIYLFMLLTIGWGAWSLKGIRFEDDLSGLRLAADADVATYDSLIAEFATYPKSSLIILKKTSAWHSYTDFLRLEKITETVGELNEVTEVSSLTNLKYPRKNAFGMSLKPYIPLEDEVKFNAWQQNRVRFPDINEKFLSDNQLYCIIYVNSPNGLSAKSINRFRQNPLVQNPDITSYVVQDDIVEATIQSDYKEETILLAFICITLIVTTFFAFTRSLTGIALILFFIGFNLAATIVFMNLLGIAFNAQMIALPALLIIFSFTDIMHLLYTQTLLKSTVENDNQLQKQLTTLLKHPILFTSLSNLFSFVIFWYLSENTALSNLSIISIIGVSTAYLSSRYLVIPLLRKKQFFIREQNIQKIQHTVLKRLNTISLTRKKTLIPLIIVTTLLFFLVFNFFKIDTAKNDTFATNPDIIKSQTILSEHFFGSKSLELIIRYPETASLWEMEHLQTIDKLETFADSLFQPLYSISPVTIVKRYHRYTINGNPDAYSLPKTLTSNTQKALEKQAETFGGNQVISKNQRITRIVLGYKNEGLYQSRVRYALLQNEIEKIEAESPLKIEINGLNVLADEGAYAFTNNVLMGWSAGILLSALLVMLFLKSFLKGFVLVLVNLLPLLLVLLLMPYLNLKINPQSLFLMTILAGLCMDDSIYILLHRKSKHQLALFPIIVTSMVLAAGFITFGFSSFNWLSPFAWIFLIGIFTALLLDLFILPLFILEKGNQDD